MSYETTPVLYVKGRNKNGTPRYLACDPFATDQCTWTDQLDEAYTFTLSWLADLLDLVRDRSGWAVRLAWHDYTCTLAEKDRKKGA